MDALAENIQKLIGVCTEKNIPVLYTQHIYDVEKLNNLQREQYDLDGRLITCDIKGDGWKFYELRPELNQIYRKYNYNIFSNEQLVKKLTDAHIKTLIITGVSTQICVETAIRNGFDLGYKIVVPEDLVATTSSDPSAQERTMRLVQKTYGVVTSLKQITGILTKQA